jgi:hypothetical protein
MPAIFAINVKIDQVLGALAALKNSFGYNAPYAQ